MGAGRGSGVSFAVAKTEVGDSGDDLRTLESAVNLARLQGGTRNRASCLCLVLFYVLRKFHEPRAVAQSTAGGGSGLYGAGRCTGRPQFAPTIDILNLDGNAIETHGQNYIYDYRKGKAF